MTEFGKISGIKLLIVEIRKTGELLNIESENQGIY